MISTDLTLEYEALQKTSGWVTLPARTLIELSGNDRCKFLHNFCTADINGGKPDDVRELFILDSRGKTLAFGHVLFREDSLLISVAGIETAVTLSQHLDKYIIRDDVQINDRSNEYVSVFLAGPDSRKLLSSILNEIELNQTINFKLNETTALVAEVELAGNGFLFLVQNEFVDQLATMLFDAGIRKCSVDALTMLRAECNTPWFGSEVDETNLPQELRRDDKAISFTKGCYLGQETVAKIDAFGHVNKFLVSIELANKSLEVGDEIQVEGKKIGVINLVTYSPARKCHIAFGYVKRKFAESGTKITVGNTTGTVA